MLGKLLKYDFKNLYKTLLPIYLINSGYYYFNCNT